MAKEKGLNYIGLDGTVGIIANGRVWRCPPWTSSIRWAARQLISSTSGGGANADVMASAMEVINSDPKVKVIFVNVFGASRKSTSRQGSSRGSLSRHDHVAGRTATRRHERRGGSRDTGLASQRQVNDGTTMLDAAAGPWLTRTPKTNNEYFRR